MGDTKAKMLNRGVRLARIIALALTGLFFIAAMTQVLFFQDIKVSFQTGIDAQQISALKMKKGSTVELPKPLKPGSYFLGWSLSPNSTEVLEDSTGLMKDTTLYAVWDGAEKYAVLSVNGITLKEVNIFDTSVEGLSLTDLNQSWRVLDDYAKDNPHLAEGRSHYGREIDPYNNFSRFLGWRYLNANNTYNDLLYTPNASGIAGNWTWIQRNEDGNVIKETEITETNKFYPPNYRTTFTALLDYRVMNIQLWDKGENSHYATYTVKLGEEDVTLPTFNLSSNAQFSHWKIREGHLQTYAQSDANPELAAFLGQVKKRYEAGEVLDTLNPLWYYYGNELRSPDGRSELQVYLIFDAVYWDDAEIPHYSIQTFTDADSGTEYRDFGDVRYNNLSVENPVAYDVDGNCFWLYYDPQILSYAFYDHKGVYHVFNTDQLRETRAITIGNTMMLLDEEIYFKDEWGINVMVNYQSSAVDVTVKFKYGNDLYLLPNYYHYETDVVTTLTSRIGNTFEILTGEKYMKTDYIFTGWQIVGDDSGRIYCAGEKFTIPNFNTETQSTVIEFVAVWHLQRLLFDFDFDGGNWKSDKGPDFTEMKGAYGDMVRIANEAPVKFGYDFVGWTLEDGTDMLKPNDYVLVGTKFQTLHAHWQPKRLRVVFYIKYDAGDNWAPRGTFVTDINGRTLYAGCTVELPGIPDNKFYTANGWQIGNQVISNNITQYQLTTQVLSQLETQDDVDGVILEVHIYANQSKRTVNIKYDFTIGVAGNYVDISENIDSARLLNVLPQGDLFYSYYPFSVIRENGSYGVFDTNGRQFVSWSYTTDKGNTYVPINLDTRIPTGFKEISVRGSLSESKSIAVEYYSYNAMFLSKDIGPVGRYNYGNSLYLPNYSDLDIPESISEWGTFVGWSFEPDYKSGNPKVIYDVHYYRYENANQNPQLQLSNQNNTVNAPYLINVDRYAVQTQGMNYTLRLFAVYANDYAKVTYSGLSMTNLGGTIDENAQLNFPVFSNGNYQKTKVGGRTVGYDSPDFADYGATVLDDNGLTMWAGRNFVGWEAVLPSGVSEAIESVLGNRVLFPGDYLPSFDFDFTLVPIRIAQSNEVQTYTVGNRTYRILSLNNLNRRIKYTGSVDIVALPRGDYTIKQGDIIINSDREVHVIIPAESNITIEPRAIQCNTIKEFYVGDNLTITGSPVIGDNFQTYRIKKGYRVTDENGVPTDLLGVSTKYDFVASMLGLLVSKDGSTLYGVPSHSNFTTETLFNYVEQSITHITEFALSDINNFTTINLAKNANLQIDAQAIYGGNVRNIILPASATHEDTLQINPQVLSGVLPNLASVTFGDMSTTATWYAFVDSGYIYYIDDLTLPNAKTHLMYALRTVRLNNLDYTNNNLPIEDSVSIIEPTALMGLDWTKINSLTANNVAVDLTILVGVPDKVPLFTSPLNPHKGPMIQPYKKKFRFTYRNGQTVYPTVEIEFSYGQTFRVFSAQKNNFQVLFDRAWSQFVSWKFNNGRMLRVGEVYKVGIDDSIIGDKYTMQFDASSADSWRAYPVQLITFDNAYAPNDFVFSDIDDNNYGLADLFENNNLGNIYLPGLNQNITVGNENYQFVGWSTKTMKTNTATPNLWNSVDVEYRILPNHTANAALNAGSYNSEGVYIYYALYEKVTPNIEYTRLNDGTYAVSGFTQTNVNSLNIPFAKYYDGFMYPISKINDNVFNGITNNTDTPLSEIAIGGAVSDIGKNAFSGVKASQINFAHKGRNIYYNYHQGTVTKQLVIRDYAFAGNPELINLTLPAAVETLSNGAFQSCVNLSKVTFETGYSPYIRNLGNFVFRGDQNMKDNAIVRLLSEDGTNGDNRFNSVGNGIFMNTDVRSINGTNKIVWRDTLLHVYYPSGYDKQLRFNEKYIAGYAFVNLGSDTDATVKISIEFTNPNVQIKANAFTFLHNSVNTIYLNRAAININNVDNHAFDSTVEHSVDVYVNSLRAWNEKYEDLLNNSTYFRFRVN